MEFLSASKLKRFRQCPYQCKYEPFKRNPATDFGTAVHAGLASLFKTGNASGAYEEVAKKLEVPEAKVSEAIKCFEFAAGLQIPKDGILSIESEDGEVMLYDKPYFQVGMTPDWGFRGAMDLVYVDNDNGLNIVDWKTGQTREEDDLQLAVYALAAWRKYGQFPYINTAFAYVQQGFIQKSKWDSESLVAALEYIKPWVVAYLEALEKDKWLKTPHKYCKFCALKDECEAFQNLLANKPYRPSYDIEATLENLPSLVNYREKIQAVAAAAYSIEELLKDKIQKVLEEAGGKVEMQGRVYTLKEKICRYKYDLVKIFEAAQTLSRRIPLELCEFSPSGCKEFEKTLLKDDKKTFKKIIESNREVKSKTKNITITLSKEQREIEQEPQKECTNGD